MILLDRNNSPTNTVYYMAAASHGLLTRDGPTDVKGLYERLRTEEKGDVNYMFFTLALDFLYLLGKVDVCKDGSLCLSGVSG